MEHPTVDVEDAGSDARVELMIQAFLSAHTRGGANIEDGLRATMSLLLTFARASGAGRKQVVGLVELQCRRYLDATPAQLAAAGFGWVPNPVLPPSRRS